MAPFSTRREGIDDDGIKGATSPAVYGMSSSSFSSLSFAISVSVTILYHSCSFMVCCYLWSFFLPK